MVVLGIIAVPAVDACATDSRGLVTCLRDMVDRRFNLPGEVPQPPRSPTAQTSPVTAPISVHPAPTASAPIAAAEPAPPEPVAVAEPPPELPKPPATTAQGGPYIPPAPERVADLRPEPVESTPAMPQPSWAPPSAPPTPKPVETVPFAPTADVFSDIEAPLPAPVATQPEPTPTAPPVAQEPEAQAAPTANPVPQPPTVLVQPEPKPPVLAATSEPTEGTPSAAAPYELPLPPVFPPAQPSAELPASPVVPAAPAPPKPAETTMAAGPEVPSLQPQPKVTAPVALAPTIDAIELEGARSFVSGSGPAGAVMRLFADDEMIGESPVEEGRWLVETGPLLTSPKRELKVEAVDPDTGKSLGQSVITVEIEPDTTEPDSTRSAPPTSPVAPEPPQEAPQPAAPATEAPETETPADSTEPPPAEPEPEPQADTPTPSSVAPIPPAEPAPESQPEPVAEPEQVPDPEPLPTLEPTRPERESASVTILGAPGASSSITTLAPREPAILAQFDPPRPRGEQSVTVLKLVPFGDPVNGRFTGGKAIIRRGDTLWTLAHRYYGAGIHYRTIFEANRDQISRPSRIFPGQIFDLPLVTND